jgi:hypothetical protein
VHKNVYVMSLSRLIQFIRDTDDVAEDIISIKPITTSRKLLKNVLGIAEGGALNHQS